MPTLEPVKYWSLSGEELLKSFHTDLSGLSDSEVAARLKQYGANSIIAREKVTGLALFASQFKNPIILILLVATIISAITGDLTDSLIILAIVMGSAVLSFFQEYSASHAIEELQSKVHIQSTVRRNGQSVQLPSHDVVPGDIVLLSAGSIIPADGRILECLNFFVDQSILTGEAFPVEKKRYLSQKKPP